MKDILIQFGKTFFIAGFLIVGIASVQAAWFSPSSAYPAGNVPEPINIEAGDDEKRHQTKVGGITLRNHLIVDGSICFGGLGNCATSWLDPQVSQGKFSWYEGGFGACSVEVAMCPDGYTGTLFGVRLQKVVCERSDGMYFDDARCINEVGAKPSPSQNCSVQCLGGGSSGYSEGGYYSEGLYYSEAGYYSEGGYYSEAGYYSEGGYAPTGPNGPSNEIE